MTKVRYKHYAIVENVYCTYTWQLELIDYTTIRATKLKDDIPPLEITYSINDKTQKWEYKVNNVWVEANMQWNAVLEQVWNKLIRYYYE